MDLTQALLALMIAITAVHWADTHRRLARVEQDLSEVKVQLADKPDRSELFGTRDELREELRNKPDRAEFDSLRGDVAALRTDLTHIALAVGAERPRKSS